MITALFLADGFEETEAIATADMIKRAGIALKTVGISGKTVRSSHGFEITADITTEELDASNTECFILPGGMPGTKNLFASDFVKNALLNAEKEKKLICAICAAPLVLGRLGILGGRKAVCFPGFEDELKGAQIHDLPAVTDGNVITSKGAGTVFEFSYEIIKYLAGENKADAVLGEVQWSH